MKRISVFLLFVSLTLFVFGQTTPLNYTINFSITGQNLWQQGTTGIIEIDHVFFNKTWNQTGTIGGITNVAGFEFGATVTAGTWGEIGSGFRLNFGTEKVDITYNAQTTISKPTDLMFDPGDRVTINTGFAPTAGCNIITDTYEAYMNLYLKFGSYDF